MDRDIPAFNQLIMNKINQKNLYMHEQRLQNIRVSFHWYRAHKILEPTYQPPWTQGKIERLCRLNKIKKLKSKSIISCYLIRWRRSWIVLTPTIVLSNRIRGITIACPWSSTKFRKKTEVHINLCRHVRKDRKTEAYNKQ